MFSTAIDYEQKLIACAAMLDGDVEVDELIYFSEVYATVHSVDQTRSLFEHISEENASIFLEVPSILIATASYSKTHRSVSTTAALMKNCLLGIARTVCWVDSDFSMTEERVISGFDATLTSFLVRHGLPTETTEDDNPDEDNRGNGSSDRPDIGSAAETSLSMPASI